MERKGRHPESLCGMGSGTLRFCSLETHFQDVGEQGWILLDLGAEDGGELHLLLLCEGSGSSPKPEKFLEGE